MDVDQVAPGKIGDLTPPWSDPGAWQRVNGALSVIKADFAPDLSEARGPAGRLAELLGRAMDPFHRLCQATCIHCFDPCCLKAKVWFDLWDLVFLHLTDRDPPPGQPIRNLRGETCRYLSHRGCRLDRFSRPWICTWYLCPTQTARLRGERVPSTLSGVIQEMKAVRKEMAARFESVVGRKWRDRLSREEGRGQPPVRE